MGTIIRTDGMIENPKYLYNGYVLTFDKTKWYENHQINLCFSAQTGNPFTLKSYGGKIMYWNNSGEMTPISSVDYIGEIPVYTYIRPHDGYYARFMIDSDVIRLDVIVDDPKDACVCFDGLKGDGSFTNGYCKFNNTNQLVFHNSKLYGNINGAEREVIMERQNIDIDFDKVAVDINTTKIFVSANELVRGSIMSLVNNAVNLKQIAAYKTQMYGDLEDFAEAAAAIVPTAKTLQVSGNLSNITYQRHAIGDGIYVISFDGNGGYTITTS